MKKSRYEYPVPEHQADATLSQANPVSGTKYTVLDTTKNVRIISVSVQCTWTVQPTPIEVHITIDGVSITVGFTDPVSATSYFFVNDRSSLCVFTANRAQAFQLEGRSVKIEAEITGGTVSNLSATVKYAKW